MCPTEFVSVRIGHVYCGKRCRQRHRASGTAPAAKPTHRITPEVAAFVRQRFAHTGAPVAGPYR
jgi:hypothetical protein